MTILHALILKCLHIINGERTIYAVFHLLTGKKSSQTIQDAHLYNISKYFKIMPKWSRQQFDLYIENLYQQHLILPLENERWIVTEHGVTAYTNFFQEKPFPEYINGLKYQDVAIKMWGRLTLLVQSLSHLNHSHNRYIPIVKDPIIQDWVRNYLLQSRRNRQLLAKRLYHELHSIMTNQFPENPYLVVARLSGYNLIGKTSSQIAEDVGMDHIEYYIRFQNSLHYVIQVILVKNQDYKILYDLIGDIFQPIPFTKTTERTYELLKQNFTIEEIAKIRGLKLSTIQDHIIEIAIHDHSFPILPYVDQNKINEIVQIASEIGGNRLKPIKEKLNDVTYFQIRLVLNRIKGGNGWTNLKS